MDRKRKAVLEQALRDMGNYGVKLRKPEDLPDFDQPSDYEEEKKRFEPIKMDEEHEEDALSEEPLTAEERQKRILKDAQKWMADDGTTGIPSRRTAMFDPSDDEDASEEKVISSERIKMDTEEVSHQGSKNKTKSKDGEDLARFLGRYLRPFRNSHRKAVYVSEETQRRLDFVVRKIGEQGASVSGYVEQVLREHLDQYKEDVERWRKL